MMCYLNTWETYVFFINVIKKEREKHMFVENFYYLFKAKQTKLKKSLLICQQNNLYTIAPTKFKPRNSQIETTNQPQEDIQINQKHQKIINPRI